MDRNGTVKRWYGSQGRGSGELYQPRGLLYTINEHMTELINVIGVVAQAPADVLTLLNCVNILLSQAVQHLN